LKLRQSIRRSLALVLVLLASSACTDESDMQDESPVSLTWDRAVVPRIIGWDSDSSILIALAVRRGGGDVWYRSCLESGLVRAVPPRMLVPIRLGGSACDIAFSQAVAYLASEQKILYAGDMRDGHLFSEDVKGREVQRFQKGCRIVGDWFSTSSRTGDVAFTGRCGSSPTAGIIVVPWNGREYSIGGYSLDEAAMPRRSTSLAIAPDGSAIALGALALDAGDSITTVSLRKPFPRSVLAAGFAPAWSPDGESIAFLRDRHVRELVVLDLVSNAAAIASVWELGGATAMTTTHPPAWSPDSRQIAIMSNDSLLVFKRVLDGSHVSLRFQ
jgi:hypothetical protein